MFLGPRAHFKGWHPPPVAFSPDNVSYQYLRSVVGVQPKASEIAPLVSEFHAIMSVQVPVDCAVPIQPGEKLQSPWLDVPQPGLVSSRNLHSG